MISQTPSLSQAFQLHQSGQFAAAAEIYQEILVDSPQNADARHLLGVVALQTGNFEQAVNQIGRAIRMKGNVAAFHANLGVAYRSLQKSDEAIACFRRAVKLEPNDAEAHLNLANALREQGKVPEAIQSLRRAVGLKPSHIEAWSSLAAAYRQLGNLEESIAALRKIVGLRPDRADYCNNLGAALHEQGKSDEAIAWYRQAIQRDPAFALPYNNLGNILQQQGELAEACRCYQRAIERKPDFTEAHLGLASTQVEQGNRAEAIQHYRTAIQINPRFSAAQCNLGIVLQEQGDFAGAEHCFRLAIAGDSRNAAAHSELANLLRASLPSEDVAVQEQLLLDPELTREQRAALCFGLAQVYDAQGAYTEAAEYATVANTLRLTQWKIDGQAYDAQAHAKFVDGIRAEFTAEFFARTQEFGLPSQRPVFLVGLPRSGTTLIEQILASHSQVFAAGELTLVRDAFAAAHPSGENSAQSSALDREDIQRLATRHLEELQQRNATALRIVDKMPDNYLYLGFLAALFPQARFILCRRDLRDVAVSCWMSNFRAIRWASDPGDLAARFRDYQRLMDHWRQVLPVPFLEVSYEETVSNLEVVARRLVAWCGLEWEPGCMEFHRGNRPVRTASSVQVRQPLYTTSVGRWRHYEKSLASLLRAMPR